MNTQYEKNSIYLARTNYLMRKREKELKVRLVSFTALLCILLCSVCAIMTFVR